MSTKLEQGFAAEQAGEPERAEALYREALAAGEANAGYYLGEVLIELGRAAEAVPVLAAGSRAAIPTPTWRWATRSGTSSDSEGAEAPLPGGRRRGRDRGRPQPRAVPARPRPASRRPCRCCAESVAAGHTEPQLLAEALADYGAQLQDDDRLDEAEAALREAIDGGAGEAYVYLASVLRPPRRGRGGRRGPAGSRRPRRRVGRAATRQRASPRPIRPRPRPRRSTAVRSSTARSPATTTSASCCGTPSGSTRPSRSSAPRSRRATTSPSRTSTACWPNAGSATATTQPGVRPGHVCAPGRALPCACRARGRRVPLHHPPLRPCAARPRARRPPTAASRSSCRGARREREAAAAVVELRPWIERRLAEAAARAGAASPRAAGPCPTSAPTCCCAPSPAARACTAAATCCSSRRGDAARPRSSAGTGARRAPRSRRGSTGGRGASAAPTRR